MAGASPLTVLVLQGGGALGAYQAGAFEALSRAGREPEWVAGISIGAVNAALIAGNPPQRREARLREFWSRVCAPFTGCDAADGMPWRSVQSGWAALWALAFGIPGFFRPRLPLPGENPSWYDTAPLRDTLGELVDFDLLNDGPVRLSVGAVDVESGNFRYFDNRAERVGAEHILASGALPPGFPAVRVDGRDYWDGGLVSNTPLRHVIDGLGRGTAAAALIFQVDLFSARGERPRTLAEAADREKDIRYSSRTRAVTDELHERHRLHRRLHALAGMLPAARRRSPEVRALLDGTCDSAITLVHLIHRHQRAETHTKDFEFSRPTMLGHWRQGREDARDALDALAGSRLASAPGEFHVHDPRHSRAGNAPRPLDGP